MIRIHSNKMKAQKSWKSRFRRAAPVALLVLVFFIQATNCKTSLEEPSADLTSDIQDYSSLESDLLLDQQEDQLFEEAGSTTRSLWRRQIGDLSALPDYDSYLLRQAQPQLVDLDYRQQARFPAADKQAESSDELFSDKFIQQQQQQQASRGGRSEAKMGPQFTREPPSFVRYLNSSELVIPCAASGNPTPSIVSIVIRKRGRRRKTYLLEYRRDFTLTGLDPQLPVSFSPSPSGRLKIIHFLF